MTPTLAPAELSSSVLKIKGNQISGLDPQNGANTAKNIREKLTVPTGFSVQIQRADGTPLGDEELVGTGYKIQVHNGETLVRTFTVILYGDASGDGRINSYDLSVIFEHVLRRQSLVESPLQAANIDRNDRVNSYDLNLVFRHVLRQQTIDQQ